MLQAQLCCLTSICAQNKSRRLPLAAGPGYSDHNAKWLKPSKQPAAQRKQEAAGVDQEGSEDEPSSDEADFEGALASHVLSGNMTSNLQVRLHSLHHFGGPMSNTSRIVAARLLHRLSWPQSNSAVERRRARRVVRQR
jgi:hypothetical protein